MTKDEGMTKSEGQDARADDSFWDDGAGLVREEPDKRLTAMRRSKPREAKCVRDSGFIILSSFNASPARTIRIPSFPRV
jgi:hypothetical protein